MFSEFIKCPACGIRNFKDDKICGICGTDLGKKVTGKSLSHQSKVHQQNKATLPRFGTCGSIIAFSIIMSVYFNVSYWQKQRKEEHELNNAYQRELNNCIYDPTLKTDSPYYFGLSGYIKPSIFSLSFGYTDRNFDYPWKIPVLVQIGPNAYKESNKYLLFKEKVLVVDEKFDNDVKAPRRRGGQGIITVKLEGDTTDNLYIINGNNFSLIPYWNCPLEQALKNGPLMARFREGFGLPVNESGEWVSISSEAAIILFMYNQTDKTVVGYVKDPKNKDATIGRHTFKPESLIVFN